MNNEEVLAKLKERYAKVHPLIFHRSLERAKTLGDLFDILEGLKTQDFPLVWHEETHCWVKTEDLFQCDAFIAKRKT